MTFTTIIPTHRNDGTPVSQSEWADIIRHLWQQFGGATLQGDVEGHWVDDTGKHYQDEGLKLTVATDRDRLQDAIETVKAIGRRLGQEAMYLEIRYYDGVQIIETH